MPNHVQNNLSITGHKEHFPDLLKVIQSVGEDGEINHFDMNAFLPIPKELEGHQSPVRIVSQKVYKEELKELEIQKLNPTDMQKSFGFRVGNGMTKAMQKDCIEKYGYDNWYDWKLGNWGTKWGAYDVSADEIMKVVTKPGYRRLCICFQTAWSGAGRFIQLLSDSYPTFEFRLEYADEDAGSNCGVVVIKGGIIRKKNIPGKDYNAGMDIYFKVWGQDENWYKDENEQWKWSDGDDED